MQQAEKLRWVQMTWAGTDIYTRRTGFPGRVTLTNASGAFGRTISEYVLGGILTMYRNFPAYREQQKQAVWRTVGAERTLYGRTVLILGTGDLGSNVAKRLRGFGTVNIGVRRAAGETLPYFDEVRGIAELDELLAAGGHRHQLPAEYAVHHRTAYRDAPAPHEAGRPARQRRTGYAAFDRRARRRPCGRPSERRGARCVRYRAAPALFAALGHGERAAHAHVSGRGFGHDRGTERLIWEIVMDNLARYLEGKKLRHIVDMNRGY